MTPDHHALTPAKPGYCGCEDCIAQAAMTLAERDARTDDAVELINALDAVEPIYVVSGIRQDANLPFNWYVVGPDGEVAYCQTENGEEHANMIAAALNDRAAMCRLLPAPPASRETPDE